MCRAASVSSDSSWKVRRAALGVLSAFIRARSDLLSTFYVSIADHLVLRFRERDSAVKEDVLQCTRVLLRESVVSTAALAAAHASHDDSDELPTLHAPLL